jgi:hypothetical protein
MADDDEHAHLVAAFLADLRVCAADVLRVLAGAGQPQQMLQSMASVIHACADLYEARGHYPTAEEIRLALHWRDPPLSEEFPPQQRRRRKATETVCIGSCRRIASMLVGQLTQRRHAETRMLDGINEIAALRAENLRRISHD